MTIWNGPLIKTLTLRWGHELIVLLNNTPRLLLYCIYGSAWNLCASLLPVIDLQTPPMNPGQGSCFQPGHLALCWAVHNGSRGMIQAVRAVEIENPNNFDDLQSLPGPYHPWSGPQRLPAPLCLCWLPSSLRLQRSRPHHSGPLHL